MNIVLKEGTPWMYVGKGMGYGATHLVTSIMPHESGPNTEVTTWSMCKDRPHSWLGDFDDFCKQFRPLRAAGKEV